MFRVNMVQWNVFCFCLAFYFELLFDKILFETCFGWNNSTSAFVWTEQKESLLYKERICFPMEQIPSFLE